jgi:2-polyprenyl-3-methyl-5-hydroxy-6-metoxy-1,4-benzoquinol methylase
MQADRFFIWNSRIKAGQSSLDYYSSANREYFKAPQRVVATWLDKSFSQGGRLFIKTHAHTMKGEYKLGEDGSVIPHCYPDIISIFDCLARACDRAGVELKLCTVNEVTNVLAALDGGTFEALSAPSSSTASTDIEERTATPVGLQQSVPPLPETTTSALHGSADAVAAELAGMHRAWLKMAPEDALYAAKVAKGACLEIYETAIASAIAERYPPRSTRIIEIGSGWGGLAILLAHLGYEVLGFEGNARRHAGCRWHFEEQIRRYPVLRTRLLLAREGAFPDVFSPNDVVPGKLTVGIATNITSSFTAENQAAILATATAFDEFILDLGRFGRARDSQSERDSLCRDLQALSFKPLERLYFQAPYEYRRFRRLPKDARTSKSRPVPATSASTSAPASSQAMEPSAATSRSGLFTVFGDRRLSECPVCHSGKIVPLWRMPMTTLQPPIELFGGYFNQVPTLQTPSTVYCFDLCQACETIFLNPVSSAEKETYRNTDHYIRKMTRASEWTGYEENFNSLSKWIPDDARIMIDAACGVGQYLKLAQRHGRPWKRLIGLELGVKYVQHMREEGFDAHVFDIDEDDLSAIVPSDSADFITFCEGFEHVERPLDGLRKLLGALRQGGRLYFTAQRYGADTKAAVRPGEPIYIGERVINELPGRVGCKVLDVSTTATRYYVVLEK